ncbi:MAG TPA: hypothetical protein VK964_00365 [Nocardioidaceae bacterium]|nr:hypothetical protein [Nocardioidaceae bacterium]
MPLRRAGTEGEAGVPQTRRQIGHHLVSARAELPAADALGERDSLGDVDGRSPAKVRGVHGSAPGPELLGEREHPVGESLHVVEQHDFGHLHSPSPRHARPPSRA